MWYNDLWSEDLSEMMWLHINFMLAILTTVLIVCAIACLFAFMILVPGYYVANAFMPSTPTEEQMERLSPEDEVLYAARQYVKTAFPNIDIHKKATEEKRWMARRIVELEKQIELFQHPEAGNAISGFWFSDYDDKFNNKQ